MRTLISILIALVIASCTESSPDVATLKDANAQIASVREGQLLDSNAYIEELELRLQASEGQVVLLRERLARLESGTEGSLLIAEREKGVDAREIRLQAQEESQVRIQANLDAREAALVKREREFYAATNVTQQEIGEAREMRQNHEGLVADLREEREINRGLILELQEASKSYQSASSEAWGSIFNTSIILTALVALGLVGGLYMFWRVKGLKVAIMETRTISSDSRQDSNAPALGSGDAKQISQEVKG
jgi:hypothetical protein